MLIFEVMRDYQHIYLSPHYDDVALSCGGSIHRQEREGQSVLVMTLFARAPGAGAALSALAREVHAHMGALDDVIHLRRREDRASLRLLGADSAWLPFHDAIYRARPCGLGAYTELAQLFKDICAHERALAEEIAGAIEARSARGPATVVYAPLGVGHHVDHQLGNLVGWSLVKRGWTVRFYEDFPYCEPGYVQPVAGRNSYPLSQALDAQPERLVPQHSEISDDDLQARIRSVEAHRSQLELVFGDPRAVARRITEYSRARGGRGASEWAVERFWTVPAATEESNTHCTPWRDA